MEVINSPLQDAKILTPQVFEDERGYFMESFNQLKIDEALGTTKFVQDNQSLSQKGVLRGLHLQAGEHAQGKLVRVIKGSVLDVIIDIRPSSPTFGKQFSIELSESNKKMLWVPPGFAHGFATLEDETIFFYKVSNLYNKASERCILWNDKDLGIDWKVSNPIISEKDQKGTPWKEFIKEL